MDKSLFGLIGWSTLTWSKNEKLQPDPLYLYTRGWEPISGYAFTLHYYWCQENYTKLIIRGSHFPKVLTPTQEAVGQYQGKPWWSSESAGKPPQTASGSGATCSPGLDHRSPMNPDLWSWADPTGAHRLWCLLEIWGLRVLLKGRHTYK